MEARGRRGALVLGLALALAAAACKRERDPELSPERVRVRKGRLVDSYATGVTAAVRGPAGRFAVGTARGGVLVDVSPGRRLRLLADIGQREPGKDSAVAQPDHDGPIVALDFSPDGRYLLSVGGHAAIWWDVQTGRMLRQVRGPFDLTSGVIDPSGEAAFFGNSRGHLYRWRRDRPEAAAVKGFFCRPMLVPPERRRLDPDQRCLVGHYSLEDDQPVCLYPVTQLARHGQLLARACREGTVGVMDLRTRRIRWSNLAGHLDLLAFVDDERLLFGRHDGELRLWHLGQQKIVGQLSPAARASSAAAGAGLVAVAQGLRIRLWRPDRGRPVGAVTVPRPVVWLRLLAEPLALEALLGDGRLVQHPLQLEQ